MNNRETVSDVCAEIQLQTYQTMFRTSDVMEWKARILSAHNREIADKDAEVARLKRGIDQMDTNCNRLKERIALLEKALKPVMDDSFVFIFEYRNAVREAQRIMKEGGNK